MTTQIEFSYNVNYYFTIGYNVRTRTYSVFYIQLNSDNNYFFEETIKYQFVYN